jgi:beta-lactamase regulating signal transducer with metallopeptidase domain
VIRTALLHIADGVLSVGLLKSSILLGVAVAVITILRRTSASVRATAWATVVVTLVALPLLWRVIPWWQFGVLAFPQPLFNSESALALALPTLGNNTPPAIWLGIAWLAGALIVFGNFVRQRIGVELIARSGERIVGSRIAWRADALLESMGIKRPVRIVCSDVAPGPFAFGLRRPTVVLPLEAKSWDDGQLDAVLRHELAHVVRGDYLLLLFGELARVLYWFNPAIWFALAALRRSQDAACDDYVLRAGVPAAQYARHLVAVARSSLAHRPIPRAALPLLGGRQLRARVGAILDGGSDRRSVSRRVVRWGGVSVFALAVTIASVDLWICPVRSGASTQVTTPEPAPSEVVAISVR